MKRKRTFQNKIVPTDIKSLALYIDPSVHSGEVLTRPEGPLGTDAPPYVCGSVVDLELRLVQAAAVHGGPEQALLSHVGVQSDDQSTLTVGSAA